MINGYSVTPSLIQDQDTCLTLTVTTPTFDISSPQYLEELIVASTSFQTIPSYPKALCYRPQTVLLKILPRTKNILLDVALPFAYFDEKEGEATYFARYIIFNQRLIGIRPCTYLNKQAYYPRSTIKKWPSRTIVYSQVPFQILEYYKINNFSKNTFPDKIITGDFFISFQNLKIAFVFQSETLNIQNYYQMLDKCSCDIISITSDIPRDEKSQKALTITHYRLPSMQQNLIKKYARECKKIVMYSSVKMAPYGDGEIYYSTSTIYDFKLAPINIQQSFICNQGGSVSLHCMPMFSKCRDWKKGVMDQEKVLEELVLMENLKYGDKKDVGIVSVKKAFIKLLGPREEPLCRQFGNISIKMKIWYLFKQINFERPFCISLPLQQKTQILVKQLQIISKFTKRPIQQFIIFYKRQLLYSPNADEIIGVKIYKSQMELLRQRKEENLYFYLQSSEEINKLIKLAELEKHIYLCQNYLQFDNRAQKQRKNQTQFQKNNKLNQFANNIIRKKLFSIDSIIIQSRSPKWELSENEQIEVVTNHLKQKLRINMHSNSFCNFILSANTQEIIEELHSSEIKLVRNSDVPLNHLSQTMKDIDFIDIDALEEEKEKNQLREKEKEKGKNKKKEDFQDRLKSAKTMRIRQNKKVFLSCHSCQSIFQKHYFYRCAQCKGNVCYPCIEERILRKKGNWANESQFQYCIICKEECGCKQCKDKNLSILKSQFGELKNKKSMNIQQILQQKDNLMNIQNFRQKCTMCQISGRRQMFIKLMCAHCNQEYCYQCRKQQQKSFNCTQKWICSVCRPRQQLLEMRIQKNQKIVDSENKNEDVEIVERRVSDVAMQVDKYKKINQTKDKLLRNQNVYNKSQALKIVEKHQNQNNFTFVKTQSNPLPEDLPRWNKKSSVKVSSTVQKYSTRKKSKSKSSSSSSFNSSSRSISKSKSRSRSKGKQRFKQKQKQRPKFNRKKHSSSSQSSRSKSKKYKFVKKQHKKKRHSSSSSKQKNKKIYELKKDDKQQKIQMKQIKQIKAEKGLSLQGGRSLWNKSKQLNSKQQEKQKLNRQQSHNPHNYNNYKKKQQPNNYKQNSFQSQNSKQFKSAKSIQNDIPVKSSGHLIDLPYTPPNIDYDY